MKEKEEELPLIESLADTESEQESIDSKTEKSDLFVHKTNGKRVGFLGAQRIADKDKGKRWETEDETRDRLTPVFELDVQEALWDDNQSQPGLRAVRDKPKRKRPSPAARRRARKPEMAADADKPSEVVVDAELLSPDEPEETLDAPLPSEIDEAVAMNDIIDDSEEAKADADITTTSEDLKKFDKIAVPKSSLDDGAWQFEWASRGYKETDPDNSGSTRIVWHHDSGWYLVMKLFDDGGPPFPASPRTIKFWQTEEFAKDRMKWASAINQFDPTEDEMAAYVALFKEMWTQLPHDEVTQLFLNGKPEPSSPSKGVPKEGQTIEPSIDGERVYDLSGDGRGQQQKALAGLENLFKTWSWEDGLDAMKLKVVEEANELNDGGNEAPVEEDGVWTFIGTSAASEALTVAVVAMKFLHLQGVSVNSALRLMQMRHEEQYARYNS